MWKKGKTQFYLRYSAYGNNIYCILKRKVVTSDRTSRKKHFGHLSACEKMEGEERIGRHYLNIINTNSVLLVSQLNLALLVSFVMCWQLAKLAQIKATLGCENSFVMIFLIIW